MQTHRAVVVIACLLCAGGAPALDVTLDAGGAGTVTLSDTDMDHIIDFDQTIGGVFRARGRVLESIGPITTMVTLTATPPDTDGIFGRVGVGTGTAAFTVTINTTGFPMTRAPLGWTVDYVGKAADAGGGIVDIPAHEVSASVAAGTALLTTLSGSPITSPGNIALAASGVDQKLTTSDLTVVFSFTPGPDDQIRLPDNAGFDTKSIQVKVFNQLDACVFKMNDDATRVALLAGNSDARCVKKGKGTDATACVDDPDDFKTDKREQKLLGDFATNCVPVPEWGVNGGTCCEGGADDGSACDSSATCTGGDCVGGACISAAAETAAGAVTHDLFGASVVVAADKRTAACQAKIAKRASKLLNGRWKAFRKCKKDNFNAIAGDPDLVRVCLGPPQRDDTGGRDVKGTISRELGRLREKVQAVCVKKGVSPVGAQFPGMCTGATDATFADCLAARIACRFCQAANRADDIVPPLDCDVFDGGSPGSCSP